MVTSLSSRVALAPRSLALLAALAALTPLATAHAQISPATDTTGRAPRQAAPRAAPAASPAAPAASPAPPAAALPMAALVIIPVEPRLHHAPPSIAFAGEPLKIEARVDFADRVRHAWLIYRVGDAAPQVTEFRRSADGAYAAVTAPLDSPSLSYCIELELTDGGRRAEFASRDAMHEVQVRDTDALRHERDTLARLGGRRSEVTTSMEFVRFGHTDATVTNPDGSTTRSSLLDQYYRLEAGYTYRVLGSVVTEFSLRGGVVRGRSQVPGATSSSTNDVGLNYGAPTLRLRLDDMLHVEGTLLTSVTEVGFSSGGGAAVLIGDPYGGKLTLGFESIATFGTRLYSRLDLLVAGRVAVAPTVEVTNMPHSSKYGVRLLTEVGLPLGAGFRAAARIGYQARDSNSGGPSGGLSLAYAFLRWCAPCRDAPAGAPHMPGCRAVLRPFVVGLDLAGRSLRAPGRASVLTLIFYGDFGHGGDSCQAQEEGLPTSVAPARGARGRPGHGARSVACSHQLRSHGHHGR